MERREAIGRVSLLLGGAMIGAQAFLNSAFTFSEGGNGYFTPYQLHLLNEIGETILPKTDIAGAREADVAQFMSVIVADCYTPEEQRIFNEGLKELESECTQRYGKKFPDLAAAQRHDFLSEVDKAHTAYMSGRSPGQPVHYFRMLKELTLAGYFTSEAGATQFLKYNPAPGRYDGCTTEKPWH